MRRVVDVSCETEPKDNAVSLQTCCVFEKQALDLYPEQVVGVLRVLRSSVI